MSVPDFEERYREWTAPPGRALRYGPIPMMADTYHGWRDGRRKLPKIAGDPDPAGEPAPADRLPELVETPRLKFLCRRGDLQIREEWIVHHRETALLTQWFMASAARGGVLADAAEQSAARLDDAGKPLAPAELEERRLAESDPAARPAVLVRSRRAGDHQRRLGAAEAAHLQVQKQLADVTLETLALADLVQRRTAVTRIRVRRIHDHTWRRIAVYWQRLVRVHPAGPELNARLAPLGPKLPRWARDDTDRDRLDPETT